LNTSTNLAWANNTAGFKNYASLDPPSASGDGAALQLTRTDRALGVRQTAAFGDPGAAFGLQITNTTGKTGFSLNFKLMSADPTGLPDRTTTWKVDYGFGTSPTSFTEATTVPATITTTNGVWSTTNVTVNFGSALDNQAGNVWIRLIAKTAASGTNNRPTTLIDDWNLFWTTACNDGNACTINDGMIFSGGITQNFDGVTAPALPSGWTTSGTGAGAPWATTTTPVAFSAPNSAFTNDVATVSDRSLFSPVIYAHAAGAQVSFKQRFVTEASPPNYYDGGVLEISINGGQYTDIITAGGSFVSGGYTGTISTAFSSPIAGRAAWSGTQSTYMTTTVNLPAAAVGTPVILRWRFGSDSSTSGNGWQVDDISTNFGGLVCQGTVLDTDGDTVCDATDTDDDNDGVLDGSDPNTTNPDICGDSDGDTCDDCAVGTDNFGPLSDKLVNNDGTDNDSDGQCNAGDGDDDNDGVADATDPDDNNPGHLRRQRWRHLR
jgi:hypothetical protein